MNKPETRNRKETLFTPAVLKLAILTYLALGIILTLAIMKPYPLTKEADPFNPVDVEPEWYLLATDKVLNTLPGILSAIVLLMIPSLFIMLPYFERRGWLSALTGFWRIVLIIILTMGFAILTWGLGC
jgi:quinol-cytochrome oxidoreductase complex cytochrome b subunit